MQELFDSLNSSFDKKKKGFKGVLNKVMFKVCKEIVYFYEDVFLQLFLNILGNGFCINVWKLIYFCRILIIKINVFVFIEIYFNFW